jgi:hypothetical protein
VHDVTETKTIAYIRWKDASFQEGVIEKDDLLPDFTLYSVGFLIEDRDDYITISQDLYPQGNTFREVLHIPTAYIEKIKKQVVQFD